MIINRFIVSIFLTTTCGLVYAECLPQADSENKCRFASGDAWCYEHGNGNPYAYSDECFKSDSFEKYAVPIYRKSLAKPNFRSLPGSIDYRTRIREGIKGGVNFAGHYTVIWIGCGGGCHFYFVVDVKSGKILDFPLGGENNLYLRLDYRPNSKLIKADWNDWTGVSECFSQEFILQGDIFKPLHQAKRDDCNTGAQ